MATFLQVRSLLTLIPLLSI